MKKFYAAFFIALPAFSWANADAGCAKIGASMYIDLTDAIVRDLHINRADLVEEMAAVNVLETVPVSKIFAEQMAATDFNSQTDPKLKKSDYFEGYYTNGAKSITAKYTFINSKGQRDIFIASSLFNNEECSVRFNGYLTLSREF